MGVLGVFIEAILMSIVTGWIFYKLDGSLDGIRSRQGAFYVGMFMQAYGWLVCIGALTNIYFRN